MSSRLFTDITIGIVSNFAGNVLAQLSSRAVMQIEMANEYKDELERLKSEVSYIEGVLTDTKESPTNSHSLKDWLQKLKDVLYDADDVLDEISTEDLRLKGMTNQVAFKHKMASKIRIIRERLDQISAEKDKFGLIKIYEPRMIQDDGLSNHQIGTYSSLNVDEVIGRDDSKRLIKDLLLDVKDHKVSFIAIVGMGGIGKTTLAKLLYNDSEVSKHFDLKMWVGVSDQFEVDRVVEKMIESASGSKSNVQEMGHLCCSLKKGIEGNYKYLLVMDDVWDESGKKWEELKPLLMDGARGSKILITMCNDIIPAEVKSMTRLINLEGLSDDSSWSLFEKVASFKKLRNPNMIQLGKEILEKCGGVPLVIRHIGRVLYSRFYQEEWISIKKDELLRITGENNYEMTNIFRLSYKHLPPHLKQCFSYSSLYTKNDRITKHELMRQWVAHGFVKSSGESKSMEDIAHDYFIELCWRFFYEDWDGDNVGIHDIMRDLSRKVAGTEYAFGNLKDGGERIRHFSLCHDIKSLNDLIPELLKAKGLRTLHMSGFKSINEVDLDNLVYNFPRLRVLDVSGGNIKRVPDSLRNLKHLRYLDLSKNLDLQSLPNFICELVNLRTLCLNYCKALRELPKDIENLVNLRHL